MARAIRSEEYVVIGLGRFGQSLAMQLESMGHAVLAIDRDKNVVQDLADDLTQTVALDATDEAALREIGIESFDTAVVAIGDDFESNVLITVLLKEFGLRVICKALNKRQKMVLQKIGADEVVLPEYDAGVRLARRLTISNVIDSLEIEPGVSVSELRCPGQLIGHSLADLNLHERFGITVLILKGKTIRSAPSGSEVIKPDDTMVIIGPDASLAKLESMNP